MGRSVSPKRTAKPARPSYVLDEQIGFILRQVWQRHATIFAREIGINVSEAASAAANGAITGAGDISTTAVDQVTRAVSGVIDGVKVVVSQPFRSSQSHA